MGSDAITLNFSKELIRLHRLFHAGFGEIRLLKWRDIINSRFASIQANIFFLKLKRILTKIDISCVKS